MSVSVTNARDDYTGNDVTQTFSYTFWVNSVSDLEVVKATFTLDENNDKVWTETVLGINNDYTVSRNSGTGMGSVTLTAGALESDYRLSIRRKMAIVQQADIKNAVYSPRVHETIADKATYIAQQIQDDINRTLKLHITDNQNSFDTTLPPGASDNPTATIMVNADGDGFEWGPDAADLENASAAADRAEAAEAQAEIYKDAAAASASAASSSASTATDAATDTAGIEKRIVLYAKGPYTSNQTLETLGQVAYCDTSSGGFTVTLPLAATMNDVRVVVKKTTDDANVLVVDANGAETIDGELSINIEFSRGWVMLISDGTEWHVIG